MGLAQGATLPATSRRSLSTRGQADVAFLLGEQRASECIVRQLFGRILCPNEYAGLAGAPDDAKVEVGASDGRLYIEMRDPVLCGYYLLYRTQSAVVLLNDGFRINVENMRGHGLGLEVFCSQVRNAATLGVDRIEAIAGRRNDENGYYTWPRYGFQGRLPASIRHLVSMSLDDSRTILDLMSSEKGRDWWRENGVTIPVQFRLAAGSRSRRTLARYVRERTRESRTKRMSEKPPATL
jgi:hypothetical protein